MSVYHSIRNALPDPDDYEDILLDIPLESLHPAADRSPCHVSVYRCFLFAYRYEKKINEKFDKSSHNHPFSIPRKSINYRRFFLFF